MIRLAHGALGHGYGGRNLLVCACKVLNLLCLKIGNWKTIQMDVQYTKIDGRRNRWLLTFP